MYTYLKESLVQFTKNFLVQNQVLKTLISFTSEPLFHQLLTQKLALRPRNQR